MLVVSHDTAGVARADRVVGIVAGRVVFDGPPEGLLGDAALLARVGLSLPPAARLAAALRDRGIDVPVSAADAESVVTALWR